jgi:HK97 family phage prohead protease
MKLTFQAVPVTLDAAAGDEAPRTITGLAVPWDTVATVMSGEKVLVRRGAFNLDSKPKLLEGHDMTQLRGVISELEDSEDGLLFSAQFAKTRASDDAVELVKAGAYDSVSAGFTPTKFKYDKKGVLVVEAAEIHEISLVAMPAWKQAVITEIAASSPEEDDDNNPTDNTTEEGSEVENTPAVEAQAETIPTVIHAAAKKDFKLPSVGEYVSKMLQGGTEFAEFNARLRAGAPDIVTSDLSGLLPEPIVQPVMNSLIGRRPLIDAVGARQAPRAGKLFIRPSVTTHSSISAVTENNNNIQSGTLVVTDNQVTKVQYGGYVEVSQFSIDTTSPEILSVLIDDMSRVYARQTDDAACTAFQSGITNTNAFSGSASDPADWAAWIAEAASDILDASTHLPTHLFVSSDIWQSLLGLSDSSGRPIFVQAQNGPMNSQGVLSPASLTGSAWGMSVVVDPNFSAGFLGIGNAMGFEVYEDLRGALSVDVPNQLSRTVAFYGYMGTLMIEPTMFIKNA